MLTAADVDRFRAQTPGCAHRAHLNNAGAALMSQRTLDAMTRQLDLEARIGGYEAQAEAAEEIESTYAALARLVGGERRNIALFDNSTHAWDAAFYSTPLREGDRILTGRNEYGSSALAYLQVAQRTGAHVDVVPDDDSGQLDLAALADMIDDRVKLIGLTWIPTAGGLVNPAAEVGRIARDADVLCLLDATQAVGQLDVDVTALGCDLLTGTGRKFLRGPRGTGFLWAGDRALERLDPYVTDTDATLWDGDRGFTWADGAARFETWEQSYVNVVGLGAAVDQALEVGLPDIEERCRLLGARLRDALAAIDGVEICDLGSDRCAIVTAAVRDHSADAVAAELAGQRINVSTTVPGHQPFDTEVRHPDPRIRLSPHYYSTEDELDRAVAVIADVAGR